MSSVGLWSAKGAERCQPLFSQTQTIGSFQTAACSAASWKVPRAAAPSPKKIATTRSSPSSCTEVAAPAPRTKFEPSVPPCPSTPISGSTKWTVPPPLPPTLPPVRPSRSPSSTSGAIPLTSA